MGGLLLTQREVVPGMLLLQLEPTDMTFVLVPSFVQVSDFTQTVFWVL